MSRHSMTSPTLESVRRIRDKAAWWCPRKYERTIEDDTSKVCRGVKGVADLRVADEKAVLAAFAAVSDNTDAISYGRAPSPLIEKDSQYRVHRGMFPLPTEELER